MILEETFTLENQLKIPKLGLGTWLIDNDQVTEAVKGAISLGYRLIDTAQAYGNESGVGAGLRECEVAREEIFVTDKIAAEHKSYDSALISIDDSLEKLGLDYIDLLVIHSPQPWKEWRSEKRYFEENKEVWRAMEKAYCDGKVKAIGVSNFLIDDMENILSTCEIKPMVNQVLFHIGNTPNEIIEYCRKNNILAEGYSPIAHGEALKNPEIGAMAKKYNVSIPQLCIKYVIDMNAVAIPKTANIDHMKNNAELDFKISDEDLSLLNSIDFENKYGKASHFPVFSGRM